MLHNQRRKSLTQNKNQPQTPKAAELERELEPIEADNTEGCTSKPKSIPKSLASKVTQAFQKKVARKGLSKAKGIVGVAVHEFYFNLALDIYVSSSPRFFKVYVRGHVFDFSPAKINSYLECPVLQSTKPKELDQEVNLDIVTAFLTVWIPNTHAMNVSRDFVVLLYSIGAGLEFDMGKHIFETIKAVEEEFEQLESLPSPIKVSKKLFASLLVVDVQLQMVKFLRAQLLFLRQQRQTIECKERELEGLFASIAPLGAISDEDGDLFYSAS
ncbi:hypothetical protein TIFTF001_017280 [Ficus carica]|uniref:Putative plant transposon protein domain-containing protein n=1 Tax=Ficus carica TaxID=3494 RepID=A0AA88D9I5_FICCA|nr:hypothetical protein TIFTF001_017280 [Ficus carica]